MLSSDDEQDDNIYDQLKSIRPFTIDQLYQLHPDVGVPPSSSTSKQDSYDARLSISRDQEMYQNLIEYEQLRQRLCELKNHVKKSYRETHDRLDKAWILKKDSIRKIAMCQQGKIAETTFSYNRAILNDKQLDTYSSGFEQTIDAVSKEYIYYSFESQMRRHKIATKLYISQQESNNETRRTKLQVVLSTLVEFLRQLGDSRSEFTSQCHHGFCRLAERMLEENTTDNYQFIIAQISRGPAGSANWASSLIECKPFEQMPQFESVPKYITHCSTLLTELFNNLRTRISQIADEQSSLASTVERCGVENNVVNANDKENAAHDQNWSLIDPRFVCAEEVNVISDADLLSEADVIKLCLKIPIAQIFRAYVKKCLTSGDNDFRHDIERNFESIMLELLTLGTVIIKTYQTGLETFNSIRYGSLIEYLSSQIRRTVIILSEQWNEFRTRLKGVDDALMMRLQVEYDNFILRSILIILELRQSGIWRHLSQVEPGEGTTAINGGPMCDIEEGPHMWSTDSLRPAFAKLLQVTGLSSQPNSETNQAQIDSSATKRKNSQQRQQQMQHGRPAPNSLTYEFSIEWFREVSEPMLWHILWQFYHNAFVSSCDYNSDNFWLSKFSEKSVVYLFVNKIKDSPTGECSYLLNSITSMLLSRNRQDSKLIDFIATEIFNLSFGYEDLKAKITKKGISLLIKCAEKFPRLISLYLSLMAEMDYSGENDGISISGSCGIDWQLLDNDLIDLIGGCSLTGWLCTYEELDLLASWLSERPLASAQNKISRIILSKLLLNSPDCIEDVPIQKNLSKINRRPSSTQSSATRRSASSSYCFIDLKMRRRLALLLYEATVRHLPETNDYGPQSLGAFVELAFGDLYCERGATVYGNLLELATDTSYQQFYVWAWRLLFTLRLHILNQPETDWNDLKSRSGTSRSIRNTVLIGDSFHPVPAIQDTECLLLSDGVKKQIPMASFIYLMLTDSTWQTGTFNDCLIHLNVLASSGHTTPSLMAMKFLTICHLSDLSELAVKDTKCLDYFVTIVLSNFDSTRLASLIMSQLDRLKQSRQIQLSQFYVSILLQVAGLLYRRISASWFANDEVSLEKIACLLDYLVRFNFPTQRMEMIHKFCDCAYMVQDLSGYQQTAGWFGSFLSSSSSSSNVANLQSNASKCELLTNLHSLAQKYKKYTWLNWITTECDTLRLEKIWEDIVAYLSSEEEANLDSAIRRVCPQVNASIFKSVLPIHSWIRQIFDIVESDLNHPLCPLIWYNFFLHYFANSLNGTSVGYKLISQETIAKLMTRLDSLFNYHLYKQSNRTSGSGLQQTSLAHLYKAYKLWLQDSSLRDAYIDMDKLREDYLVPLLKAVMESSSGSNACLEYIDLQTIKLQNDNLMQIWLTATRLTGNHLIKEMVFVDNMADESMEILTSIDDEASDATSLIMNPYNQNQHKTMGANPNNVYAPTSGGFLASQEPNDHFLGFADDELQDVVMDDSFRSFDETIELIKRNFKRIFDDVNVFNMNINELDRTKSEIIDLVRELYKHEKREIVRTIACGDGNMCIGPARIKFEVEEAERDERKSHCIQDRQRQCQGWLGELLKMPLNRTIDSTVAIEENVKRLIADPVRSQKTIETLLAWMSEPTNYKYLNGNYHVANHLLKTCLEILSTTQDRVDDFNTALIDVCLAHPEGVQIFSPHLSPSACSNQCFLNLYERITSMGGEQKPLEPMATFVLLSKFDLNSWLDNLNAQDKIVMHHEMINATCSALGAMGKDPDESYELAMGLFRRHLQIELAMPDRRRPEELMIVLGLFLKLMSEHKLAPYLWVDFMALMGFEARSRRCQLKKDSVARSACSPNRSMSVASSQPGSSLDTSSVSFAFSQLAPDHENSESTIENMVLAITKQSEHQTTFDYHSLDLLIKQVANFMEHQDEVNPQMTLLEVYSDYLDKYASFMLSVTFMWIRAVGEQYPDTDNHKLIWKQFMQLWHSWIFLDKNCQNVGKASYSLVASYFATSIRYMMHKIPGNSRVILQSVLLELAKYVEQTKEVVYLELTLLQRSLKNLAWSSFLAGPEDLENLCSLSEQENYNISELVSYIILQIDSKKSLGSIAQQTPEMLPRMAERLATTIVLQSSHLKGYRLNGNYFNLITLDQTKRLSNLVLQRMESVNLEQNQINKLLINLLRSICIRLDAGTNQGASSSSSSSNSSYLQAHQDTYDRTLIYAQFISNYLIDLIHRQPGVAKYNRAYLAAVVDSSLLQDLKTLLSASDLNLTQKTILYEGLMECCSSDALVLEQRYLLSRLFLDSISRWPEKNRQLVVLETLHAVGQILRDSQVLVETVESLILMHLVMNGRYEQVWRSFCLKVLPSDIYLSACIELKSSLAILIYFEALVRGKQILTQDSQPTNTTSPSGGAVPDDGDEKLMAQSTISNSSTSTFNTNRIWSSFFHWLGQLVSNIATTNSSQSTNSQTDNQFTDIKLIIVLVRMLELLGPDLQHFILSDSTNSCPTAPESVPIGSPDVIIPASEVMPTEPTSVASSPSNVSLISANNASTTTKSPSIKSQAPSRRQQAAIAPDLLTKLSEPHKCLLEFIRQSIALYDSQFSTGLWSYLSMASSKDQQSTRLGLTSLAIASFLVDRALININATPEKEIAEPLLALRQEIIRYRRLCLSKLESARKSKNFTECIHFIDTMLECLQGRTDRVQYADGVQSISRFVSDTFFLSLGKSFNGDQTKSSINHATNNQKISQAADNSNGILSDKVKIIACLEKILPTL